MSWRKCSQCFVELFDTAPHYCLMQTTTSTSAGGLHHPCKDVCSGWKQGFEAGRQSAQPLVETLKSVNSNTVKNPQLFYVIEETLKRWESEGK